MDEIDKTDMSEQTKFRVNERFKIILTQKLIKENHAVKN